MNHSAADYLWDPTAPADTELQALERLLRPLSLSGPSALPALPRPATWGPSPRPWAAVALVALLLLGLGLAVLLQPPPAPPELRPGSPAQTVVAAGRREVRFGELASIVLQPGSELRFEHWHAGELLLRLQRGGLEARVQPPPQVTPGFFLVDTPLGRCIDQGCRYELSLRPDGSARVRVTEGAVVFAFPSREVFVPAGASTVVDPRLGPSIPLFLDSAAELKQAVAAFDLLRRRPADPALRLEAWKAVLAALLQRPDERRNALVLFHLLDDPDPQLAAESEKLLEQLVGPPEAAVSAKEPRGHWSRAAWLQHLRQSAF